MPFSSDVKTRMFVRCGRLCCLCLKQCGTNIEAAHIVSEVDGGSDKDENGIPLCFDCHQETGAYDPKHPKGNVFRKEELVARRDRVYALVESGEIYAQIVAARARREPAAPGGEPPEFANDKRAEPSREGRELANALLKRYPPVGTPGRKVSLLSESDRAYVLDTLLSAAPEQEGAAEAIAAILASEHLSDDERRLLLERVLRDVSLRGSFGAKLTILRSISPELMGSADEVIRTVFFDDLIDIVKRDQYQEVNKITRPLTEHETAIPVELSVKYVAALVSQANSNSFEGAPAARRALGAMPGEVAGPYINSLSEDSIRWLEYNEHGRGFVRRHRGTADSAHRKLLDELLPDGDDPTTA